jgi:hypothetical protein
MTFEDTIPEAGPGLDQAAAAAAAGRRADAGGALLSGNEYDPTVSSTQLQPAAPAVPAPEAAAGGRQRSPLGEPGRAVRASDELAAGLAAAEVFDLAEEMEGLEAAGEEAEVGGRKAWLSGWPARGFAAVQRALLWCVSSQPSDPQLVKRRGPVCH